MCKELCYTEEGCVQKKRCGIDEGRVQGMLWYRGKACIKNAVVHRRGACKDCCGTEEWLMPFNPTCTR